MDTTPPVDLVWTQTPGGEECIGQRELGTKVRAALGHPEPTPEGAQTGAVVRGSVGPVVAGSWIAAIEVRRGDTPPLRRELTVQAPDCRQLDEAIVLVVALLLDASVSRPSPLTIARTAPALSVSIGPDVALAWGMLPAFSFGFGLVSEARIGAVWPIVLSAHEWRASSPALEGTSGGQLKAFTVGAALCPPWLARNGWEIFACAGGSGGAVDSAAVGLDRPLGGQSRPYLQVDAQMGFRLRVAPYLVTRLALGAGFPLVQYAYSFRQPDMSLHEVFRTSVVIPAVQAAIELRTLR